MTFTQHLIYNLQVPNNLIYDYITNPFTVTVINAFQTFAKVFSLYTDYGLTDNFKLNTSSPK